METTSAELVLVPDEELQRLADERGPTSAEAQVLVQLTSQRAQDLQVYAFRAADQYVTGPLPEAAESAGADELLEAMKRMSTPRQND
jgi:hypothetical protein